MRTADCLQLQINTNQSLISNVSKVSEKNVSIQMYARIKQYKKQSTILGVFHDHHLYFSLPEHHLLTFLM